MKIELAWLGVVSKEDAVCRLPTSHMKIFPRRTAIRLAEQGANPASYFQVLIREKAHRTRIESASNE
ncbi:hypothetical protein [Caballeronia sp. J97]|uniref:hypothetical protein n=1 Tax=Caballeronia sp. J97 TaxID=2805429 RepID=UPI002AAF7331|nr:hypothetical protein [Caballeronia sp. J97]